MRDDDLDARLLSLLDQLAAANNDFEQARKLPWWKALRSLRVMRDATVQAEYVLASVRLELARRQLAGE